jgi:hypothetical protein
MTIDLSQEDFELLLLALGIATGFVRKEPEGLGTLTTNRMLRLANQVNKNNPNWTPYRVQQ